MRAWWVVPLALCFGCASTVARLDGEVKTPAGPPRNECEKKGWLVLAPTRAEIFDDKGRRAELRDDGFGLYRIGSSSPESIPSLADELGRDSPSFLRHENAVAPHDTKQLVAGGLGAAGLIAIAVGSIVFVTSFETKERGMEEEQSVDGAQAALGGALVGAGFGLGIAGLSVNPGQAERSRAAADRYVFLPPADSREQLEGVVARHNQRMRERCNATPTP